MLLSFPVVVPVEKNILPPFVPTAILPDPNTEQFVMVLPVASAINRMVAVPDVADAVVLDIVNELPPVFNPLMVTLSAPLRLINGEPAVTAPEMVRAAPPDGEMVILAHAPAFKEVVPASEVISPVMETTILLPVCAVALIAANNPPALVSEV